MFSRVDLFLCLLEIKLHPKFSLKCGFGSLLYCYCSYLCSEQLYYKSGFPKSDLRVFVAACTDEASSGIYRRESSSSLGDFMEKICCCKKWVLFRTAGMQPCGYTLGFSRISLKVQNREHFVNPLHWPILCMKMPQSSDIFPFTVFSITIWNQLPLQAAPCITDGLSYC